MFISSFVTCYKYLNVANFAYLEILETCEMSSNCMIWFTVQWQTELRQNLRESGLSWEVYQQLYPIIIHIIIMQSLVFPQISCNTAAAA